jgi:hypothetical protein
VNIEVRRGEPDVLEGEGTVCVTDVGDLIESADRGPDVAG